VPAGRQTYSTRLDDRATSGLYVDVSASLDPATRVVTWTFTSIDPKTLDVPQDASAGFLPPDTNAPNGEGWVTYTVHAKAGVTTGTRLNAQATVVFDATLPDQSSLNTPAIYNTLDASPPTSSVGTLPAFSPATFPVTWSGQDDAAGSGLASDTVYVSDNGGPFTAWQTGTTQTSATFTGQGGHSYRFYSVATDNVGHVQATPTAAQATTTVDTTPPTSAVYALPAVSYATSFPVSWWGQDNAGGSGLRSCDVYVSVDGSPYYPWLTGSTPTSATYTGSYGHRYAFSSVATDNAGNRQAMPTAAEAEIALVGPLTGDVTAQMTCVMTPTGKKRKAGPFKETLTVVNRGGQPLAGPLSVVVRGLKISVKLRGAAGYVGTKKKRSPFVVVNPGGGLLMPGASATATLTFSGRPNAVRMSVFAAAPPK
jgi:hypothetical protein